MINPFKHAKICMFFCTRDIPIAEQLPKIDEDFRYFISFIISYQVCDKRFN